jgi:polar amino acid transport system substrate-binding protein
MKQQSKSFIWLIIFLVGFPQISETIYTPSLNDLVHLFKVSANDIQKTLSIYFAGFAIGVFFGYSF